MLAVQSDIWFEFLTNLKGTVRVISSEPPCKDANARFTTVPIIVLSDLVWIIFFFIISDFSAKVAAFLAYEKSWENPKKLTLFEKWRYLPHFSSI